MSIPEEVYEVRNAEVLALRSYSAELEAALDKVCQWIIAIHGLQTLNEISPALKNQARMIAEKSNSGLTHRL